MRAGTKQPYKSVRKGNKMIFSTITQNNLNLAADTTEIPAQYLFKTMNVLADIYRLFILVYMTVR